MIIIQEENMYGNYIEEYHYGNYIGECDVVIILEIMVMVIDGEYGQVMMILQEIGYDVYFGGKYGYTNYIGEYLYGNYIGGEYGMVIIQEIITMVIIQENITMLIIQEENMMQ